MKTQTYNGEEGDTLTLHTDGTTREDWTRNVAFRRLLVALRDTEWAFLEQDSNTLTAMYLYTTLVVQAWGNSQSFPLPPVNADGSTLVYGLLAFMELPKTLTTKILAWVEDFNKEAIDPETAPPHKVTETEKNG